MVEPPWMCPAVIVACVFVAMIVAIALPNQELIAPVSVAFIGNSIQYYNDMPRFLEALSENQIEQNSCLHGDATFESLVYTGSGMYPKFQTDKAFLGTTEAENGDTVPVFDYGACTIAQLLFGIDDILQGNNNNNDGFMYVDDGKNPCFVDDTYYLEYTTNQVELNAGTSVGNEVDKSIPWDYVVLNDNSRAPGRYNGRLQSLTALEVYYVRWLQVLGVTPILLATHGYSTESRNLTEFVDIPTFTSYTYEGYLEYKSLLDEYLLVETRIAPVGLAFLTIWEENYDVWTTLFHYDEVHPSPSGTFLQGLVVFHAIYGRLPRPNAVLRDDMSTLWSNARRMQPDGDELKPYPNRETAEYLYHIAKRVCIDGHVPKSFIVMDYGEGAITDDDVVTNYNAGE